MKRNSNEKSIENSCNRPLPLHSNKKKKRKEKAENMYTETEYLYRSDIFKIHLTQGKSELIETSNTQFSAKKVLY